MIQWLHTALAIVNVTFAFAVLILEVEVQSCKHIASKHSSPGLWALLDRLSCDQWPALIRGDRDWGTEVNMQRAEQGWQGAESEMRLTGWSRARRVIVLRRRVKSVAHPR